MKNRIKELREARELTQEQLAELANTTHSTIQRLESGKRRLTDLWVGKLSRILKCHPGELFAPLPSEADRDPDERQAVALVRMLDPDVRPTWFQAGSAMAQRNSRARRAKRGRAGRHA